MPHSHQIYDSDKHFVIDPITRNITNNSSKITIMQYDHNSERFTFEIPRIIEGHDMSLSDIVRVHFINIGSIKTNTNPGVYEVDDVTISLDDPDTITFSWLISGASTKYNGSLHFAIRFYCLSDESVIEYSWGTNIYSGINVANSIDNSEAIAEDYVDVLEKWKQDVIDICIQPATKTNLGSIKVGANLSITEDGTLSADAKEIEIDNETIVKTEDGKLKANIPAKPLTYDYMPEGYPSKSGWSIEWDGNTDGLVSVNDTYYKVSDMMPTDDELIGATIKANNGASLKLSSDDITALSEDITLLVGETGFVARKDNVTVGDILLPQKGTYLITTDGTYVAELSNQTITPMAEEFLPPLVAEIQSAAEAAQATADRKVDIENPNFTGAFSHNRKADSMIGSMSFAEGCDTKASGDYAHAEGHGTTAGGQSSHAEGEETTASGYYSHAEGGNTSASGQHSHAEGQKTTASASWSHAEGYETTASGYRSHAEGIATEASGEQSHAEGEFTIASGHNSHAEGHGTTASGHNSHVEGKYNIEDTDHKYAHIVGNGTEYVKSNAYTLDWDGNGWFAGTVEADANILRSSVTDSTKKFKLTVDDSGIPSLTNTEDNTEVWTPSDVPTKTSQLENDSGFVAASELAAELANKQDIISDLATIRSGAAKGATALQAVPSTYRTASAQDVVDNGFDDRISAIEGKEAGWDGKYVKPTNGIPKTDLANDVQASLDKADAALQEHQSLAAYRTSADQDVIDGSKQDKLIAGENITIAEDGKTISATGGGVQSDWNQNDSTAADYVKNRPFYTGDPVETVLVEESTVPFKSDNGLYMGMLPQEVPVIVGETYKVYWDSTAYECTCVNSEGMSALGNLSIAGAGSDTGEPFVLGVINGQGTGIYTADTSASHTISIRGLVPEIVKIDKKYLPFLPKPDGKSYLTFSSPNSFTLATGENTKTWNGTLEYFASDGTWTVWDGMSSLSAEPNGGGYVIYLRGTGNTVISGGSGWDVNASDITCIGNIENLLDYATVESGEHPVMAEQCFGCMFSGWECLTQAPELPATTLASYCYDHMFESCTSLTQAPELPATTLADGCYQGMFWRCASLTQAPKLPATTLANYCYNDMFLNCTSLTQIPALPATTIADGCYRGMFKGCTNLKLSATKTEEYTQEYRIPFSGDGTSASLALDDMFVSTGGTFTGTPQINTTYYLSSENMIVRGTEIATLNGYVKSMIDNAGYLTLATLPKYEGVVE